MGQPQVQGQCGGIVAAEVKIQLIAFKAVERLLGQHVEVDAQRRGFAAVGIADLRQSQRVQVDVGAGAKLAGDAVHGFGKQPCPFGNHLALTDRIGPWLEPDDGRAG
ncbi:hypothetical protein D3C80_1813810 [compost metagenome]